MDRFIARENIRHFRERLWMETDPDVRARLQNSLIEEEDKLGASYDLLADVQRHIADTYGQIEKQRAMVDYLERKGYAGLDQARSLLGLFMKSHSLHRNYRDLILIRIKQNGL